MSGRRKTVRAAQLEGRADGMAYARTQLVYEIQQLFNANPQANMKEVRAVLVRSTLEMEVVALRDLAIEQRKRA